MAPHISRDLLERETPIKPPRWLPGPHLPTIWASTLQPSPRPVYEYERLELPDGDFVDLASIGPVTGAIVIVLHGLEGGVTSPYIRRITTCLGESGFRCVVLLFRGCSGIPNRLQRSYHSGDTGDLDFLYKTVCERFGRPPLACIGYSIGGNVLLRWLTQESSTVRLKTAIAVCVPYELEATAEHLNKGFSRVYQARLVQSLKTKYVTKFATRTAPIAIEAVKNLTTFHDYDDCVTAPLHNFESASDYYHKSSSKKCLSSIKTRTLLIGASDDPFVPEESLPDDSELGQETSLEMYPRGGHLGFCSANPLSPEPCWLDYRILAELKAVSTTTG